MSAAVREHDVVITGCGVAGPLGVGVERFGARMFAGHSGTVDIRGARVSRNFPVPYAGLVPRDELGQPEILAQLDPEHTPLSWRFAGCASEEALAQLPSGARVDAVVYATADGTSFDHIKDSFRSLDPERFPWTGTRSEAVLEMLAELLSARGHGRLPAHALVAINNACVSSNQALGVALHRIRRGRWTRALVGGVDARCDDHNFMNFNLLGALSVQDVPAAQASRPFTATRAGFVRGEGAASLLVESRAAAEARGARILGLLSGYAATSDAYRLTDGRPDGVAVVHAMRSALADAALPLEQLGAISAHGTSTRLNDLVETQAIKRLFGAHAYELPVVSLKSQTGHATVAAGALEAVASLLMLREQRLAPTINYRDPDPECDLDYVPNQARAARVDSVLSNNFGFGGQNACVVFQRAAAA